MAKPRREIVMKNRGEIVDVDAVLASDSEIWPKTVAPLIRCLIAYDEALDSYGGSVRSAVQLLHDEISRIAFAIYGTTYWPGEYVEDHQWPMEQQGQGRHVIRRPTKRPIPADLRWTVFERDGYACRCCGSRRDLHADHVHPESKGGPTTLENLQTLCRDCNVKKGTKLPE